jgi:hypothetical protein
MKIIFQRTANFPWRVANHGSKSALKVLINTHPETGIKRPDVQYSNPGVIAIVQHSSEWPKDGHFIAAGSLTSLSIKPTAYSTSDDVRALNPEDRQCYFSASL